MNHPEPPKITPRQIADVQSAPDTRNLTIDKVGVKDLRHPIRVKDRSGYEQHTVAIFNMYVELPHNFKGTHMSRFVEILSQHERETSVQSFRAMLKEVTTHLDAEKCRIEMTFPFFLQKKAPVSGVESLMDYEVTLAGELVDNHVLSEIQVTTPVTSLCPCSKEISDYGAHNQRSHVKTNIHTSAFIWIEEIIEVVEKQASCELYGILKRPDEKHVTERAYDNPKFVEDLVRDIAMQFNGDERIQAYTVSAENFESIHNHSAYAEISRNKLES
ncbi:MAG: GTP cyclohydrolase I FolE2 [Acidiferrobacteraceae bacterium]|nr:GTP cyclohydrolase I FolE2 [Acidiferrobacteraceae bacterium]|tara:strand:- start:898 stop:1716 length:819 start_codon:yes stop_codon:yes gene_type:complete